MLIIAMGFFWRHTPSLNCLTFLCLIQCREICPLLLEFAHLQQWCGSCIYFFPIFFRVCVMDPGKLCIPLININVQTALLVLHLFRITFFLNGQLPDLTPANPSQAILFLERELGPNLECKLVLFHNPMFWAFPPLTFHLLPHRGF